MDIMDLIDEYYSDKDLSLLKKLTLVIPTYNRNYYLSRCLWYHAHFPFGEIIVADSSLEEKKVVNRETVAKVREMFGANIRYLEYEPETEKYGGDIYRKWGDAVQHVETEYSVICTDKEFLIPLGLLESIKYLEYNLGFIASDSNQYFIKYNSNDTPLYQFIPRRIQRSSESSEDSLQRFTHAFVDQDSWANCLLPALFKSNVHKEIFQQLQIYGIDDLRFGELILSYCGHLCGKYYHSKESNYLVRDVSLHLLEIDKRQSKESSTTRYPSMSDYNIFSSPYKDFYGKYLRCMYCNIKSYAKINDLEIQDYINKIFTYNRLCKFDSYRLNRYIVNNNIIETFKGIYYRLPFVLRKQLATVAVRTVGISIPQIPSPPLYGKYNPDLCVIEYLIQSTSKLSHNDIPII